MSATLIAVVPLAKAENLLKAGGWAAGPLEPAHPNATPGIPDRDRRACRRAEAAVLLVRREGAVMNSRAPLSPAEIARRAELAAAVRIGAVHQDELVPEPVELAEAAPRLSTQERFVAECPVDEWIYTSAGLRRWRAIFDNVEIIRLPHGNRILNVGRFEIRLDRDRATHLAQLLSDENPP